ncbi:MAG: tetratricopeptide repeat protein [Spirochaetaceae bacterium]
MEKAVALLKAKRFRQAIQALLDVEVEPEERSLVSYYLGLSYTHLGKFDEALLYLEQVATGDIDFPFQFQSRMILGYIYTVTRRPRLAEFEFKRLLADGFESTKVYSALGHVLYAQGKSEAGIKALERALELDEDNATALNSLGYILADEEVSLEKALDYCKRAVSLRPGNAACLDSLGWIYFKLRRLSEARSYLRKAKELDPGNEVITGHLKTIIEAAK